MAAIVIAVRPHGENDVLVRALTETEGVIAGYVPGGRSRTRRPVLQPGNSIELRLRHRGDGLPIAQVEPISMRSELSLSPLSAATVTYLTNLVAGVIEEGAAHPRLYAALSGLLDLMTYAESALVWLAGIVRFELLLLEDLGFGLDLATCAATGVAAAEADLAFVSPKSSHGVGRVAGMPYAAKLLPLPAFLRDGSQASLAEVVDGLTTTGYFLEREILIGRAARLLAARSRFVESIRT